MLFSVLTSVFAVSLYSPQTLHQTNMACSNPREPVTPSYFATNQFLSGAHFYRLVSFLPFTLLAQEWIVAKEGLGRSRAVTADLVWFKVLWICCHNSLTGLVNLSRLSENIGVSSFLLGTGFSIRPSTLMQSS